MSREPSALRSAVVASTARSGAGRRVFRWLLRLALLWILITALPVLALRWLDPPTSAFMLKAQQDARSAHYRVRYRWVDWPRISPQVALAVVASEDQLFQVHRGFDFKSMRGAAEHNGRSKRLHGASTITQQVAKNLFLWSGRSYLRKAIEAWFTALIELTWSKQRILEIYLNIAQFGRGIFGVEAASREFFHEPAAHLSPLQSATLAAVLPNPLRMHAQRPSSYVQSRRDEILMQMRALGGTDYLRALR